ncbi:MAG: DNA polymerase III subunit delta' [Deltaproteobacteria bacterium]|jgi:DNA polymerase-3 subunit delta'|nr:DNA polymerase III subunit delta' [Deltaproteobacteria bacterium]
MALSGIVGQQRAVSFLKRILKKEAVPHAFLFSGMTGSGKLAAAVEFARALNCQSPQDHDSCGVCGSCRKLDEGLHPDIVHVRSDGAFIKLEQIRELVKRFRFRPFEGKFRVVIIHDAQRMMELAANALLKILEEPPEANLFILLAVESQMLLPTIVSRCCQVRFQPLEDRIVAERLVREEGLSPDSAAGIARLAEGSIEKARWFSRQDQAEGWKRVIERLESLAEISILDFFPMVSDWAKGRETMERDLEFIKLWVRDLILFRVAGARNPGQDAAGSSAALTFELNARTEQAARSVPVEHLFILYQRVELAMQGLRVNANLQMTLEGVCLAIKDFLYGKGNWNSFSKRGQALSF